LDIDFDGDLDLFISGQQTDIVMYENTGTEALAQFTMPEVNPLAFELADERLVFAFADVDGDNDQDVLLSGDAGHLTYIENIGSQQEALFMAVTDTDNPFDMWQGQQNQTPLFIDIDQDFDLDLILHQEDGSVRSVLNQSELTIHVVSPDTTEPTISLTSQFDILVGKTIDIVANISDEDGDELTISWQQLSGPTVSFETLDDEIGSTIMLMAPEVIEVQTVTFEVTVTDGRYTTSAETDVVIYPLGTAVPGYGMPEVTLTQTLTVDEGTTANIMATVTDSDTEVLNFDWHQVSGPVVSLSGTKTLELSFIAPAVDTQELIELIFTVDDGYYQIETLVQVTINDLPNVDSEPAEDDNENPYIGLSWSWLLLIWGASLAIWRRVR
jgi:hypothetical protein